MQIRSYLLRWLSQEIAFTFPLKTRRARPSRNIFRACAPPTSSCQALSTESLQYKAIAWLSIIEPLKIICSSFFGDNWTEQNASSEFLLYNWKCSNFELQNVSRRIFVLQISNNTLVEIVISSNAFVLGVLANKWCIFLQKSLKNNNVRLTRVSYI